jgi:hypothetical protein
VRLTRTGGVASSLRVAVGSSAGVSSGTDVGQVPAAEAAAWLLTVAREGGAQLAERAIFAATLADSAVIWPQLLTLARDDARPRRARDAATFALSRLAAGPAAEEEPDENERVRAEAVFALSRRPRDEAVPALTEVARRNPSARVRAQALFWLGETHDPRALDLFEEMLGARR